MEGAELESGVRVPSGTKGDWHRSELFVGGALFADDAAGFTEDLEGARLFCDRVTQWCMANEMAVGISKCGILEFPSDDEDPELTESHPERPTLLIGNQLVPIVTEYKYLGLRLTVELDRDSLISGRLAKAKKTANSVLSFLRCGTIPIPLRLTVIRAVVLPRCLYGAEVFGMNRALTTGLQTLLDKLLRGVLGLFGGKHWVPSAPMWHELRVVPVCAITAARRARAYLKCFQLHTTVGRIIQQPMQSRRWTWSNGIPRWINRFCVPHFKALVGGADIPDWTELQPRALAQWVQDAIAHREKHIRLKESHRHHEAARWYFDVGKFGGSPLARAREEVPVKDVIGVSLIIRARIGALRLAPELAQASTIPNEYKTKCPFCRLPEPETLNHLLLQCPSWAQARGRFLGELQQTVQRLCQHPASQSLSCPLDEARVSWALGGVHGTLRVRSWGGQRIAKEIVLQAEAQEALPPGDREYDSESVTTMSGASSGSVSSLSSGGRSSLSGEDSCPPFLKVARFLRIVMRQRALTISALSRTTVGNLDIAPATATGQRPDG